MYDFRTENFQGKKKIDPTLMKNDVFFFASVVEKLHNKQHVTNYSNFALYAFQERTIRFHKFKHNKRTDRKPFSGEEVEEEE